MSGYEGLTRAEKRRRQQAENDLEHVLASAQGRRVLMELISATGVLDRTYGADMAFREGRRSVGLDLIEQVEAHQKGGFLALQIEALKLSKLQGDEETKPDED